LHHQLLPLTILLLLAVVVGKMLAVEQVDT
jgi:uncharacterized integral membrane protein